MDKKNNAPFNSQVKVYKDKIYVIDFENTLRAYSINDGKEIWNRKNTELTYKISKKIIINNSR